jgi:hypothetical protein
MTKGIPRKQRLAEQRHARRVQGAAAKTPPTAMPEPLPPAHYPAKRVAIAKRQVAGGGA